MTTRKTQNSIIALATLGVYLGLLLAGATPQVLAQAKPVAEVSINKKPLVDFADDVARKSNSKEVDLNEPFSIEYEAFFDNKGRLDLKRSRIVRSDGDPKLVEVARRGIEAVGDSGWFQYVRDLGVEKVTIIASQDNENVSLSIQSEAKTKERARTIVAGLNTMVRIGAEQAKNSNDRLLLQNTKATSNESIFTISLVVPYPKFQEMILSRVNRSSANE